MAGQDEREKEETRLPVATCLGSDLEEDGKGKRSPVHLSSSPEIERKSPEKEDCAGDIQMAGDLKQRRFGFFLGLVRDPE